MSSSEPKRYSLVDPINDSYRETPEGPAMEGTYRMKHEDPPGAKVEANTQEDFEGVKFLPDEHGKSQNGVIESNGKDKATEEANGDNNSDGKKEEKKEKPPMVSMGTLFRYATRFDVILITIGVFCSIAHGVVMPLQFVIFGDLITVFTEFFRAKYGNSTNTSFDLEEEIGKFALYYVFLAIGTLVIAYGQMGFWSLTAARQIKQIRLHFFRAILNQDIGWFDCNDPGELNTRLTDDLNKVYDGIGHKVAIFIQAITLFLTGFVLGFFYGWKLTLVMLSVTPLLAIAGGLMAKLFTSFTSKELDSYAKAGSIAEEVLSSIRTVGAFGGEEKEYARYTSHLSEAKDFGVRKGFISGLGLGSFQIIIFGSYALSFWYGSTLIISGEMKAGDLLIVFFAVMVAATQLGQAGPNFEAIANARGAAHKVFLVIDRESPINPSSEEGEKPDSVIGNIAFKDVHFVYPSREEVKVLTGLNLNVESGKTVALVGESGCGKSTVVKLIKRFYDPQEGQVLLDGRDLRSLNVAWLRHHIGIVSQEPVLFATTIAENIRYGQEGITQEEIEKAARMANAHDFISKLPQGYETLVGERGAQLSGGQKQRVAIARALVRDPKILLLDEATSALDTESESVVQAALDKAREGRTTIVIAHRLSTVRNADKIAAVQDGQIAEMGTHSELMQTEGVYRQLVTLQTFEDEDVENEDDDEAQDVPEKEPRVRWTYHGENVLERKKHDALRLGKGAEAGAALHFMRSLSSLSSDEEHEPSGLERKVSRRASMRLSARNRRPGSAFDRQKSIEKEERKEEEVIEEVVEPAPIKRIIKMNLRDWPYLAAGTLAAMGNGAFPLVFALLLSEVLNVFTLPDKPKMKEKATFWSLCFLALGGGSFFCQLIQNAAFAVSGEKLTMRLRQMAFKSFMRQSMSYFDDPAHSTGALCTVLATHSSDVKGATGAQLGTLVISLTTVVGGLIYAFFHDWRLTLLVLAFVPFQILASALQMKIFTGQSGESGHKDEAQEEVGKVAVEAIENVRTIASLGKEKKFYEQYAEALIKPHNGAVRRAHFYGVSFGVSEAIMYCSNAAAFRFGAFLVADHDLEFLDMMKVIMVVMISAFMVGHMSALSPDYAKAKIAAARLFKLFDNITPIDSASEDGLKPNECKGEIAIRSVRFRYPTRPDIKVLRGLNLKVEPGQRLALVGSSGCGKSTIVSLLERFYDVEEGEVSVDGASVKSLNIKWLRSQMGIVSQEPVLFSYSIAENIAYGDNSRMVSLEEVESAAMSANIHSFINTLPKGYDTNVGDKGTLISGGQKQRIAIARALIRNPRILLLDEATSALDTESEKVVQEALDKASVGRTTIVIAHRLSTVQSADSIAVIHHGRVVEQGTHQELLALKGTYHSLVMAQMQTGNGNGNGNAKENGD